MLSCLKNTQYQASTYFHKLNKGAFLIRYVFKNGRKQSDCFFLETADDIYLINATKIGLRHTVTLTALTYHIENRFKKGKLNLTTLIQQAHWQQSKVPNLYTSARPLRVAVIEEGVFLVTQNGHRYLKAKERDENE